MHSVGNIALMPISTKQPMQKLGGNEEKSCNCLAAFNALA